LSDSQSPPFPASSRQSGAQCRHCNAEIRLGDSIIVCQRCGAVHHETCWQQGGGCGSYDCAPVRRDLRADAEPALRISDGDLAAATPLAAARRGPYVAATLADFVHDSGPRRFNRLAIAAFLTALAGIPLFGLLTGLVATVLGSIALGAIRQTRQRGIVLALTSVFLGIGDVVGWLIFLTLVFAHPGTGLHLSEFDPDPAALENLPPHINRELRANVLIETQHGWMGAGIGSGVVLRIRDGKALIVTNRHVVDPDFTARAPAKASARSSAGRLRVKLLGQLPQPGEVLWVAPDEIDLALLSVPIHAKDAQAATWQKKSRLAVGDEVFSIGNPQHLDWSHTRGVVSQFRTQTCGTRKVRIIQTDAAINPGNSGGGLYDKQGNLVGINTWTNDKRFSEGISFAVVFQTLLDLDPPPLKEPAKQRAEKGGSPL
jgi:hypothetical protein